MDGFGHVGAGHDERVHRVLPARGTAPAPVVETASTAGCREGGLAPRSRRVRGGLSYGPARRSRDKRAPSMPSMIADTSRSTCVRCWYEPPIRTAPGSGSRSPAESVAPQPARQASKSKGARRRKWASPSWTVRTDHNTSQRVAYRDPCPPAACGRCLVPTLRDTGAPNTGRGRRVVPGPGGTGRKLEPTAAGLAHLGVRDFNAGSVPRLPRREPHGDVRGSCR